MNQPSSRIAALALAAAALLAPRPARAQFVDFATCGPVLPECDFNEDTLRTGCCRRSFGEGTLVIPMDRCHQPNGTGKYSAPGNVRANRWCRNPASSNDNGVFQAYGLVYRAMQQGIPVLWSINPTKHPQALVFSSNENTQTYSGKDIDFWVVPEDAVASDLPQPVSPTASNCSGTGCLTTCTSGCGVVARVDITKVTNASTADDTITNSYNSKYFPCRGGCFIVDAADAQSFKELWANQAGRSLVVGGDNMWDFSDVDIYQVLSGARFVYWDYDDAVGTLALFEDDGTIPESSNYAPVAVTIDYDPPRVGRVGSNLTTTWLEQANLKDPAAVTCNSGSTDDFEATGASSVPVYCDLSENDIAEGDLVNAEFDWAWLDDYKANATICDTAGERDVQLALRDFMTHVDGVRAGGNLLFIGEAVNVVENCDTDEGAPDNTLVAPQGTAGVGLFADSSDADEDNYINRYPMNVFIQFGDWPLEFNTGSSLAKWFYWDGDSDPNGYAHSVIDSGGTLARLLSDDDFTLCSDPRHKSTAACDKFILDETVADLYDYATYSRYLGNLDNGVAFYLGGNQVHNAPAQFRTVLNTLLAMPTGIVPQEEPEIDDVVNEVSRSQPVVLDITDASGDAVEVQLQGSFEHTTSPAEEFTGVEYAFPHIKGHLRAFPTTGIDADGISFTALDPDSLFDAADGIPASSPGGCASNFSSSCRTVFTNLAAVASDPPERLFLTTGNSDELASELGSDLTDAELDILIEEILEGELGGIDRSTLAHIEASVLANATRPSMIYVGGLDGMLHAICATETVLPDTTGCGSAGQELWAFIPRVQLNRLRFNTQRLDGSPKVADLFIDHDDDGTRTWRTILTFQTGSSPDGAVYALDVTEPGAPVILWEKETDGIGLGTVMGPVRISGTSVPVTIVQTNNGGGAAGARVMAFNSGTGELVWDTEDEFEYPGPRTVPTPLPISGILGGAVAFDPDRSGALTHVAFATLYGDLFVLDAADGTNRFGSSPLFRFSEDYHPIGAPPTVYRSLEDGAIHLLVLSGGYVDSGGLSWSPDGTAQFAVSIPLDTALGDVPVDEGVGGNDFVITLDSGFRGFAQAIVAGNELFITSDSTDVNSDTYGLAENTGQVQRFQLVDIEPPNVLPVTSTTELRGGASSVDVNAAGVVYSGSATQAHRIESMAFDEYGLGTELEFEATKGRQLWIKLE